MRYLFEDYVLDTERRELRRGTDAVAVAPQVFDLLNYLVQNRERVVSKDDLIAAIWGGRIVSDAALTTRLNVARSSIGDTGEEQRLIKTLPRKGFRFIGVVREETAIAAAPTADAALEPPRAATLGLPDKPSIAVLPFANVGGDAQEDYFADGITDDIITELSRFSELVVIARNSSFQYKGKSVDVREVARELGVRYVLEGSIRRSGERVRITAQLVDATTGAHRWAERYDRELQDVFAVQDQVARTIVALLAAHVNRAEVERTLLKPPATWQAYDHYMRGADVFASYYSSFDAETLYEARRHLVAALAVDPTYARAHAKLGATYTSAWFNKLDDDYLNPAALDRAHHSARRAVQLAPNLSEAHAVLGFVLILKGQHDASIAEFERAIALNPNYVDWRFGLALVYAGQPARGIEVGNLHPRLDPFYPPLAVGFRGYAHYVLKQYEQALAPLRELIARAPNSRPGHVWLAATYAQLGQLDQARREVDEVLRILPTHTIEMQKILNPFRNASDLDHMCEGLRRAGLPER